MKQEDLEKTQYMRPEEIPRTRQAGTAAPVRPRLEDTQSMPPVDGEIQPPIPQRGSGMGNIRELAPDDAKGQDRYSGDAAKQSWLTPKRKKRLLLGGGFAAALLIGFMIAGYTQDQSAAKQNQRQYEQQQMKEKEQKLVDQERDLKARREQLEQQKKDLVKLVHESLGKDGFYIMGMSEYMSKEVESLFRPYKPMLKIFQKAG